MSVTALGSAPARGRKLRVLIVGAGFVGCEVAATARTLGAEVDVELPGATAQRPV